MTASSRTFMGLLFFLTTFIVAKKTDLKGFILLNWINLKLVHGGLEPF